MSQIGQFYLGTNETLQKHLKEVPLIPNIYETQIRRHYDVVCRMGCIITL